jgi:uncharacterized damage-inducible protein DinB
MPNPGAQYAQVFMMHRAALTDLMEKIPQGKGDFAPWEGGRSFIKLADHLSGTALYLAATARGSQPQRPQPSANLAEASEGLKASGNELYQTLESLSPEQLSGEVMTFLGSKMPLHALVDFLINHEAHHKGQIWLMARMVGVEPALFVKLG